MIEEETEQKRKKKETKPYKLLELLCLAYTAFELGLNQLSGHDERF